MNEVNVENKVLNKTILLVDDDQDYLLEKKIQLEHAGYKVITADSAKQGLELLEQQKPDIMVVDLMMEEHDSGFSICYFSKKRYPDVPVIIVTGVVSETGLEFDAVTREERSWIKADAMLSKPIRFEQLESEIRKLLK
jgi:CheY-like chemotaxis protein